jgi:hypothetical protein
MKLLLSWIVALAFASSYRASELIVYGTPGATLSIDGESKGSLPMTHAIELEPGRHLVSVQGRGYRPHNQEIELGYDESASLEISLATLYRSTAVGSSLLLAGMGQIYENRPWPGYAFLGIQLGAALTAILAEASYKDHRDELARAQYAYDQSIDPEELDFWRSEAERQYAKLEDVETIRDTAVWTIVGAAVLSALEAWWHFPAVEVQARPERGGVRLGLGGAF